MNPGGGAGAPGQIRFIRSEQALSQASAVDRLLKDEGFTVEKPTHAFPIDRILNLTQLSQLEWLRWDFRPMFSL